MTINKLSRGPLLLALIVAGICDARAQTVPSWAAANAANANGAGLVYVQYDVPPPANVQATDGTILGKVDISWNAVSPTAKYWVYRDGVLISSSTGITATSFTDTAPDGYKTYSYTVTAGMDGGVSDPSTANTGYALADGGVLKMTATDGTVTDKVTIAWTKIGGADGYRIYKNDTLLNTVTGESVVTFSDTSVAGQATVHAYAVAAYKGATETSKSTDNGYANVTPASLTGDMETLINKPSDPYVPVVTDANIPGDTFIYVVTAQGTNGAVTVVGNKLIYTPNVDYQGNDVFTVRATDKAGATVTGDVKVFVGCPNPTIYGAEASDDLTNLVGLTQVAHCGDPVNTKVSVQILNGGREVKKEALSLTKVTGDNLYYSFTTDIGTLSDGTYTINMTMTDAYNHTATANSQLVVDWNGQATPSFTYKSVPVFTGSTTTESLGNIGIK
jgi:hypothetical protein